MAVKEAIGVLELKGESALLMHNIAAMGTASSGRKKIPQPEDEAAKGAYWTSDKSSLCLYSYHIHAALIAASSGFRIQGRRSVIPYMSGCLRVQPDEIPLGTDKYEVDVRAVVVQRSRVIRARPKVYPWAARIEILFDPEVLSLEFMRDTFPEIVSHAGRAVGLLDFRPAKRGPFGRFSIASWTI